MKLNHFPLWGAMGIAVVCGAMTVAPPTFGQEPAVENDQNAPEVLTRGPVHEAFAETVSYDPEPGLIIEKEPPAAIEELPPDQQPEGDNVTWIPGYWAWDDEGAEFLWVSGIWRNLPPGRQWVPGYWDHVEGGYQWVSGYWSDAETTEAQYLPEPPESVETGPNIDAPSDDQVWAPGNWAWVENRYAWSPGYWQPARTNWIWNPGRYVWTPRGYLYVSGYWDYDVARRGVLFAPVRFHGGYYSDPGYYYSPVTVINLAVFSRHLFLRPRYSHYYFGDYYEPRYRTHGYFAPFAYHGGRRGYDPIFAHQRWENRNNRNWLRDRERDFNNRRDNVNLRPPRNLAAMDRLRRTGQDQDRLSAFATSLPEYVKNRPGTERFRAVNDAQRQKLKEQRQAIARFASERRKIEVAGRRQPGASPRESTAERVPLQRSPILGRAPSTLPKAEAPPTRPTPRPVDRAVVPKPRERVQPDTQDRPGPQNPGPRREVVPGREGPQRPPSEGAPEASPRTPRRAQEPPQRSTGPGKASPERGRPSQVNPPPGETPPRVNPTPPRQRETPSRANPSPPQQRETPPPPRVAPRPRPTPSPAPRPAPQPRRDQPAPTPPRAAPHPAPSAQPRPAPQPPQRANPAQPGSRQNPSGPPRRHGPRSGNN